jgi:hypothetical protein
MIGKKWSELDEETKQKLLSKSNVDRDNISKDGSCTVDFEVYSIAGRIDSNENEDVIVIDDDAVLYDSVKGVES